jgi:hypothetical protein
MVQVGTNRYVPISERPLVPKHLRHAGVPEGARYGDIVIRPCASIPLVIVSPGVLDDGSGQRNFSFQRDPRYRIIGSVYESIDPLLPLLEATGRTFDSVAYGLELRLWDNS